MPQLVRIGRDIGMGFEPGELPGPARERHHALVGRKIEHDMAGRGIARPGVEGYVGVQRAVTSRICVNDLGADRDLFEVRGRDRAEVTGESPCTPSTLWSHGDLHFGAWRPLLPARRSLGNPKV
jgi:hypothetical protein